MDRNKFHDLIIEVALLAISKHILTMADPSVRQEAHDDIQWEIPEVGVDI